MAAFVCPVASAMSPTLLPSANQTATLVSAGVSSRVVATKIGIDPMLAPRLDNQHQRGNVPRSVVRLGDAYRTTDERRITIDSLTATAPEAGNASPTRRSRRTWSAGARARSIPFRSNNPSPCRRMLRAQSFTTGGAATLKQVLVFGNTFGGSTRVSIYSDSSGQPGSSLRTGRDHFNPGYGIYVTVDDLALTANTTYWVVFEGKGYLRRMSSSGEDALPGWSLGDRLQVRTGGTWRQHSSAVAMRLEVLGTPTAALSVADAEVDEAEGATLDFTVTLNKRRFSATWGWSCSSSWAPRPAPMDIARVLTLS